MDIVATGLAQPEAERGIEADDASVPSHRNGQDLETHISEFLSRLRIVLHIAVDDGYALIREKLPRSCARESTVPRVNFHRFHRNYLRS